MSFMCPWGSLYSIANQRRIQPEPSSNDAMCMSFSAAAMHAFIYPIKVANALAEEPSVKSSQAVLAPPRPNSSPALHLALSAMLLHSQASFNPLLTRHLAEATECS